jgi:hypothetical protein
MKRNLDGKAAGLLCAVNDRANNVFVARLGIESFFGVELKRGFRIENGAKMEIEDYKEKGF